MRASRSALTSVLPTDHTSNYFDLAYLKRITKPTPIARPESARIKRLERKEATIGTVSARVGETTNGVQAKILISLDGHKFFQLIRLVTLAQGTTFHPEISEILLSSMIAVVKKWCL